MPTARVLPFLYRTLTTLLLLFAAVFYFFPEKARSAGPADSRDGGRMGILRRHTALTTPVARVALQWYSCTPLQIHPAVDMPAAMPALYYAGLRC